MTNAQVDALVSASPIVLDLNGDGVHTSAASQGVNFDLAGTGHSSKMGWTDGTDGLLAIDLNHDGRINDGTELFGVGTRLADGTRAGNGYAAPERVDLGDVEHNRMDPSVDPQQRFLVYAGNEGDSRSALPISGRGD